MTSAIYPGSFDPWHAGHQSILTQAIKTFDKVTIAIGINPSKAGSLELSHRIKQIRYNLALLPEGLDIEVVTFGGLLKDFIDYNDFNVVIKGLRNSEDFEYEKIQQYWNEDLGIKIPTFYVIADRNLCHISSSAIKMIEMVERNK